MEREVKRKKGFSIFWAAASRAGELTIGQPFSVREHIVAASAKSHQEQVTSRGEKWRDIRRKLDKVAPSLLLHHQIPPVSSFVANL